MPGLANAAVIVNSVEIQIGKILRLRKAISDLLTAVRCWPPSLVRFVKQQQIEFPDTFLLPNQAIAEYLLVKND